MIGKTERRRRFRKHAQGWRLNHIALSHRVPRLRTDINLPRRMSKAARRLARSTDTFERRYIGGMQLRTWRYG